MTWMDAKMSQMTMKNFSSFFTPKVVRVYLLQEIFGLSRLMRLKFDGPAVAKKC